MGRSKKSIYTIVAEGNKQMLSKAEIEERAAKETFSLDDNIEAPDYLDDFLKKRFNDLVRDLGGITNAEVERVARVIIARDLYRQATTELLQNEPNSTLLSRQDKLFKQVRAAERDLFENRIKKEVNKENKFSKFM